MVGGRDALRTILLALEGLLFTLIETYREVMSSNEGSVLSEEDIPADMAAKRQKRVEECSRRCPGIAESSKDLYTKALVGTVGLSYIA